MKIITLSFLAITALIIGIGLYILMPNQSNKNIKKIAIFTPITHAALEEIEQGFRKTMLNNMPAHYEFTTFNANGNKTLQRAQAEEIVNGHYDLIFTIGASCSQIVAEIAKKRGSVTPHVFGAIDDEAFAQDLAASNKTITGVFINTLDQYRQQIDILHQIMPNIKNVLLVYDPSITNRMERNKQEVEQLFKKYNITLQSVEVSQANEIQQKVTALLAGNDLVLVLKDNTVVSGIDSLITLCNRYGIPLCVSDLNSGQKGAAIAYGTPESESGVCAAKKAQQILLHNKKPHELAVTPIRTFTLIINKNAAAAQKLIINPETLKGIQQTNQTKEVTC